jgi:eukaryotic-like serine/threonine-protein kinase
MLEPHVMGVHDNGTLRTSHDLPDDSSALQCCGEWRLLRELAAGGFGQVFEAAHAQSGQRAAVKLLRGELSADADAVGRFEREAALLEALSLPGFVELYELGRVADGRPFMAMELLDGHDLAWWVEAHGRLSVPDALAVLSPLCQVLGAAHSRGVVHRDIKASNVFLTGSPRCPERVTVLDFGLGKLLDSSASPLTGSRQILGTPASMAPEQIAGAPVDERTDIYALGALTYQLLTAEPPFKDSSLHVVCQMHLKARVPSVSARAPVSADIDAVVVRAMAKRREDRYSSCAEFLGALTGAARSSSTPAPRELSVVMLSVAASVEPDALARAAPGLREAFEAIVPLARIELEHLGMKIALRVGDLLLAYWELAADPSSARLQRRRAIDVALDLNRKLTERLRGCSGVGVTITVASGSASEGPSGLLQGPEGDRARGLGPGGVLATEATLAGLELRAIPCGGSPALAIVPEYRGVQESLG